MLYLHVPLQTPGSPGQSWLISPTPHSCGLNLQPITFLVTAWVSDDERGVLDGSSTIYPPPPMPSSPSTPLLRRSTASIKGRSCFLARVCHACSIWWNLAGIRVLQQSAWKLNIGRVHTHYCPFIIISQFSTCFITHSTPNIHHWSYSWCHLQAPPWLRAPQTSQDLPALGWNWMHLGP